MNIVLIGLSRQYWHIDEWETVSAGESRIVPIFIDITGLYYWLIRMVFGKKYAWLLMVMWSLIDQWSWTMNIWHIIIIDYGPMMRWILFFDGSVATILTKMKRNLFSGRRSRGINIYWYHRSIKVLLYEYCDPLCINIITRDPPTVRQYGQRAGEYYFSDVNIHYISYLWPEITLTVVLKQYVLHMSGWLVTVMFCIYTCLSGADPGFSWGQSKI